MSHGQLVPSIIQQHLKRRAFRRQTALQVPGTHRQRTGNHRDRRRFALELGNELLIHTANK